MKNAEEFIKALLTDKDLAEKANAELSQCKTEDEAIGAVTEFAKTRGYEFDAEEFTDARDKIREMSDKDLDNVTGGVGLIVEELGSFPENYLSTLIVPYYRSGGKKGSENMIRR